MNLDEVKAMAVGLAMLLCGCERAEVNRIIEVPIEALPNVPDRFDIRLVQRIEDRIAYGCERRIYVILDRETGKEYVGISGVGIAETGQHSAGRSMVPDER